MTDQARATRSTPLALRVRLEQELARRRFPRSPTRFSLTYAVFAAEYALAAYADAAYADAAYAERAPAARPDGDGDAGDGASDPAFWGQAEPLIEAAKRALSLDARPAPGRRLLFQDLPPDRPRDGRPDAAPAPGAPTAGELEEVLRRLRATLLPRNARPAALAAFDFAGWLFRDDPAELRRQMRFHSLLLELLATTGA